MQLIQIFIKIDIESILIRLELLITDSFSKKSYSNNINKSILSYENFNLSYKLRFLNMILYNITNFYVSIPLNFIKIFSKYFSISEIREYIFFFEQISSN